MHAPSFRRPFFLFLAIGLAAKVPVGAADDLRLESFPYPFAVEIHRFKSQQQEMEMAYMEVKLRSAAEDAPVVVLLHGKNFSGAYWEQTARTLSNAGYRVVLPDQIGFGKSTKPLSYQFTFQQLAANTHGLLEQLGVKRAHFVGHSMGGMLAVRYALMFPDATSSLTLVNPLGLEDWKAKGVPHRTVDLLYQQELKQTAEKIKAYQQENYYGGDWRPAYDRWVTMLVTFTQSPDYPKMAWNQALTSEMIHTQPVCYEFGLIEVPTLLIVGQRDRTAPGRDQAPALQRSALGNYPELGRAAVKAIPGAKLVELDGVGHAPHLEAFDRFIKPLKDFLGAQR